MTALEDTHDVLAGLQKSLQDLAAGRVRPIDEVILDAKAESMIHPQDAHTNAAQEVKK